MRKRGPAVYHSRMRSFGLLPILITAAALGGSLHAQTRVELPLWPHSAPEASEAKAPEALTPVKNAHYPAVALTRAANVSVPTLTLYPVPAAIHSTGAAAVVFPGGGYMHLSMVLEGSMPCDWFNSIGMACILVKYRVPWAEHFPQTYGPLEDAQQAMRLVRAHAAAWHIDPKRIGVLGFSAGGHLAVVLSQHFDDAHVLSTPAAGEVDATVSARPDFVMLAYPAYLPVPPDMRTLDPNLTPNAQTPPTFIMQSEDDKTYVDSSLVYARALKDAHVPEEYILYPNGGHGSGMHPAGESNVNWPDMAAAWLHTIHILPSAD
jgi:acetyl esterase/lipase